MTTQHTPRQWELRNDDTGDCDQWLIVDATTDNDDVVATVPKTFDEGYDDNVVLPNARLIAAAPELLRIVLDILPDDQDDYSDGINCDECGAPKSTPDQTECDTPGCWYVRIRETIAKATGQKGGTS